MATILVSNDDGIAAPGLKALVSSLRQAFPVQVVAPKMERSGASSSITLMHPFQAYALESGDYALDANPADCILFAMRQVLKEPPLCIVSGINRGPNLGDDTLYSGTVGAALTGALNGLVGIAVSMGNFAEPMYYETAARVVLHLLKSYGDDLQSLKGKVLNVNVPNVPWERLRGIRWTRLARRTYDSNLHIERDYLGQTFCFYGKGAATHDDHPDSDCSAIEEDQVSLSILAPSLFDRAASEQLAKKTWLLPQV